MIVHTWTSGGEKNVKGNYQIHVPIGNLSDLVICMKRELYLMDECLCLILKAGVIEQHLAWFNLCSREGMKDTDWTIWILFSMQHIFILNVSLE